MTLASRLLCLFESDVVSFQTERGGSNYLVRGQSTQRTKGPSQGHDDVGVKDWSSFTYYLSKQDSERFLQIGSKKNANVFSNVMYSWDGSNNIVVKYTAKASGQKRSETFVTKWKPEVGLCPVEIGDNWSHVGTRIAAVQKAGEEKI